MFDNEDEHFFDESFNEDLTRFENSLKGEPLGFMDSDSFEAIIDHFLIQGNYNKAKVCAEMGIEQFPFKSVFLLRKAQAVSGMGQLKEGLKILGQIDKLFEDSCEFLLTKASIFSQLRDTKNAIRFFLEALSVAEPEDKDEIYIDLAMEYEHALDFNGAVKILKEALQNNPTNEIAIYELAFCYDQLGDYEQAIACYNGFINENPYSFTAWYNLGNAFAKQNNHEKAIWAYDYSVTINEDFSPAYFNLGSSYLSLENYKTAIEFFLKCIEIDGDDPMCLCYIGECYEQLNELESAKTYYRKSLDINPELGDAWLGLGIVKDLEGATKEGLILFEKAIEIEPSNPGYFHVYAGALEKLDEFTLAKENYLKALELDKVNSQLINDYLDFLIKGEEWKEFDSFVDDYIRIDDSISFTIDLIKAYKNYLVGNTEQALYILNKLIVLDLEKTKEIFSLYPELLNDSKIVNLFPTSKD
jgi:tetratricopeptide (TPR) repeat protein